MATTCHSLLRDHQTSLCRILYPPLFYRVASATNTFLPHKSSSFAQQLLSLNWRVVWGKLSSSNILCPLFFCRYLLIAGSELFPVAKRLSLFFWNCRACRGMAGIIPHTNAPFFPIQDTLASHIQQPLTHTNAHLPTYNSHPPTQLPTCPHTTVTRPHKSPPPC